jgi:dTDP-4-dehydrorhamnose 3,5-epimerase
MIITETRLNGVCIIELEKVMDERGYFARCWCVKEFSAHGLNPAVAQVNVGHSVRRGTVRGMHFQMAPYAEVKVVHCSRGALYDVVLDLREGSPTRGQWVGIELTAENGRRVYVPEGCAHGYQTLADETDLVYQTSQFYTKEAAWGVRYNDPAFKIEWPLPVSVISAGDRAWPDFEG